MCYSRYRRLENHTKEIWRKADDKLLLELVDEHGERVLCRLGGDRQLAAFGTGAFAKEIEERAIEVRRDAIAGVAELRIDLLRACTLERRLDPSVSERASE